MYLRLSLMAAFILLGRWILKLIETTQLKQMQHHLRISIRAQQFKGMCLGFILFVVDSRFLILILMFYVTPIYQLKQKYKHLEQRLRYEFSIWLRILVVYLKQNTVLLSLKRTLPLAPELFRVELERLIHEIEVDPTNRDAYLSFMDKYQNYEITHVMKQLFRYSMISSQDAQVQLLRMVSFANDSIAKQRNQSYQQRIDRRHYMGFMPLLMVSAVFMILLFTLMTFILEGGWRI